MRRGLAVAALASLLAVVPTAASAAPSSWPSGVQAVEAKAGTLVEVRGNLASGKTIDLAWAASSNVACFPATRFDAFRGNHVTYATSLPRESTLTITVVPDDPRTDLSVFAYSMGTTDFTHVPPNVPSVTSCEAGYDFTGAPNPGASEKVVLNATTNPYNIVIGVAGAKGVVAGGYTLKLELKTKAAAPTNVLKATALPSNAAGAVKVRGSTADGAPIDLAFAARSAVACWPATQNKSYDGNHVVYRTALPPNSDMTITATPVDPTTELSVYAYSVANGDTQTVPPNVGSAVSCEASATAPAGKPETVKLNALKNPYTVYVGVTGPGAAKPGAFELTVEVKPKK